MSPPYPQPDRDSAEQRGRLRARLSGAQVTLGGVSVLDDADFEIREGEVAFVTGATASGKTTLLNVLRLALPPTRGRAIVLGADAARAASGSIRAAKRRLGFIAEEPVLIEHWTAFDNVALPLSLTGAKPTDFAEDVRELLRFVGAASVENVITHRLSTLERRWVAIARALAAKPDLILADAPTAGLAPEASRRIVRLLCEMSRVGAAVVITSQDESLCEEYGGAHWRIAGGRLALVGGELEKQMERPA